MLTAQDGAAGSNRARPGILPPGRDEEASPKHFEQEQPGGKFGISARIHPVISSRVLGITMFSLVPALLLLLPLGFGGPAENRNGIIWEKEDLDGPVHLFTLSLDVLEPVFLTPGQGEKAAALADLLGPGLLLAVNANFFDPSYRVLGLALDQGRELSPLRKADWGVFWVDRDHKAHLSHRKDWPPKDGEPVFAVECGPRLLVKGKALHLKPNQARRTVLGILKDGRILVAVFSGEVDLNKVAAWLKDRGVVDALNLDGGISTQVSLLGANGWLHLLRGQKIPIALGFRARPGVDAPQTEIHK